MLKPFFSVIIPTYNRADEVKLALGSISNQQYRDFEVIVSDDGSTDNTREIVKQMDDVRITFITQPNGGVSQARNAGAAIAKGRFLIFLDSDDALSDRYFESFHQALLQSKSLIAFGYAKFFDWKGIEFLHTVPEKNDKECRPELAGAFAIDANVFKDIGGYDLLLHYSENTELFMRLRAAGFLHPEKIVLVPNEGVVIQYRDPKDRMKTYSKKKFKSIEHFLSKHHDFFMKNTEAFVNYKSIYALGAFQNGHVKNAKQALIEVMRRRPLRIKTYISYLLFTFPVLAGLYWGKQETNGITSNL